MARPKRNSAVQVEDRAFRDPRFQMLAGCAGLADADHARGKMLHLWAYCVDRGSYILPDDIVASVVPVAALVTSALAEKVDGGVRIKGGPPARLASAISMFRQPDESPVADIATTALALTEQQDARRRSLVNLFAYWRERCDHPQAKLTPERATCIGARLRDGYTEAEIRKAIEGAAVAAYVDKDSGKKFDDLTLICRNGSKLEDFISRGVKVFGEIKIEMSEASSVDDQISSLRRDMAAMRKDGRTTEYTIALEKLQKLQNERSGK